MKDSKAIGIAWKMGWSGGMRDNCTVAATPMLSLDGVVRQLVPKLFNQSLYILEVRRICLTELT